MIPPEDSTVNLFFQKDRAGVFSLRAGKKFCAVHGVRGAEDFQALFPK